MADGGGRRGHRPGGASRVSGPRRGLVGWAGVRAGSARTVAASRPPNSARLGAGNGKALVSPPAIVPLCYAPLAASRPQSSERGHSISARMIMAVAGTATRVIRPAQWSQVNATARAVESKGCACGATSCSSQPECADSKQL